DHIFHQHYGRENVVRNNIFAFAPQIAVLSVGDPDFQSVSFYRNIFISDGRPMYAPGYHCALDARPFDSDVNLFWDLQGPPRFQNRRSDPESDWLDIDAVRAYGLERNSVVADPKVKDLAGRDFALAEDSPAAQIGFRPIDLSDVGPRPKEKRD
ncbi:MAG: hypothetical protein QHJ73_13155, partial [Armatimonadota bacterium]|nr:hypothetical protein [Armatimonadota bacterium]